MQAFVRIRAINQDFDSRIPAELREVEQRLRDDRPALTALELDAIKLRTMASAARPKGLIARKKGTFMKSRLALISVLALGVFMSGTGATLAVSGMSSSGSASSAQYPPEEHEKEEHLCESGSNSGSGGNGSDSGCSHESEHCGPTSSGGNGEACETQEVRQVETSSGGSLPFTGFLAIPVLIVGVGLLGAGVAMRLRMRNGNHPA